MSIEIGQLVEWVEPYHMTIIVAVDSKYATLYSSKRERTFSCSILYLNGAFVLPGRKFVKGCWYYEKHPCRPDITEN